MRAPLLSRPRARASQSCVLGFRVQGFSKSGLELEVLGPRCKPYTLGCISSMIFFQRWRFFEQLGEFITAYLTLFPGP